MLSFTSTDLDIKLVPTPIKNSEEHFNEYRRHREDFVIIMARCL